MPSKDKVLCKLSLFQLVPTIAILCMSVWSMPAETLAQQTASGALDMTQHSTLWSFEGAGADKTPYLVLGMADRENSPFYGLGVVENESANPAEKNTIMRQDGLAVNRTAKVRSDPLVLSSLFDSSAGLGVLINVSAKPVEQRPFLFTYPPNYLAPEQRLANIESSTHGIVQTPRPFFELELGGWRLPVMLSGSQSQDSSPTRW